MVSAVGISGPTRQHPNGAARGFTLVEMMIVIVIIGVLAGLGYPSYNRYVLRAERNATKALLQDLVGKQDSFKLQHRVFADDFLAIKMADAESDELYVLGRGKYATTSNAEASYRIDLVTDADADAVDLCGEVEGAGGDPLPLAFRAVAIGRQAADRSCASMTLCFAGRAGARSATDSSGSSAAAVRDLCWEGRSS